MTYQLTIHLIAGEPVVLSFAEQKARDECMHNLLNGSRWHVWPHLGIAIQCCHIVRLDTSDLA